MCDVLWTSIIPLDPWTGFRDLDGDLSVFADLCVCSCTSSGGGGAWGSHRAEHGQSSHRALNT